MKFFKSFGKKSPNSEPSPQTTAQGDLENQSLTTSQKSFDDFELDERIVQAVTAVGYKYPTPIQAQTITPLMEGRDLLGCAQTGTGKTAAFALPTLHLLSQGRPSRGIKILVLAPTRELAIQVAESYTDYSKNLSLRVKAIYGGVGIEPQKKALRQGIDILVATPGRLLDLQGQGFVNFDSLRILVLDEADRMLDMGFLPDVKRILRLLPRDRQNLLFSATMPRDIQQLSVSLLKDPVKVEVAAVSSTSERVSQKVFHLHKADKRHLLLHLLKDEGTSKVLVFTRTKAIANRISKFLTDRDITAAAIHGNKSQSARQRALSEFRDGDLRVLVASDLAARGLDVDNISHVINYDLPNVPETYVHRIGRTGRASAVGVSYSFCDPEERPLLKAIEKTIGQSIEVDETHPCQLTVERARELHKRQEEHRASRPEGQQGNRSKRNPNWRPRRNSSKKAVPGGKRSPQRPKSSNSQKPKSRS